MDTATKDDVELSANFDNIPVFSHEFRLEQRPMSVYLTSSESVSLLNTLIDIIFYLINYHLFFIVARKSTTTGHKTRTDHIRLYALLTN